MINAVLNLQSSEVKDKDEEKQKYKNFVDTTPPRFKMLKTLKRDWASLKKMFSRGNELSDIETLWKKPNIIPYQCDVLIIGGGAIGSSIAYWLKKMMHRKEFNVGVIEKDPTVRLTLIHILNSIIYLPILQDNNYNLKLYSIFFQYAKASTTLSVGGLRQQFSLEENIRMSLFGAEFLRNINEHLSIPYESPIEVNFHPYGYLILASEEGAETLVKNSKLQNSLGAKNIILTQEKLKQRFPWLNTDGVAAGCLGLEREGWFDPWSLLCAMKNKATYFGAHYIDAEVKAFQYKKIPGAYDQNMDPIKRLDKVVVSRYLQADYIFA